MALYVTLFFGLLAVLCRMKGRPRVLGILWGVATYTAMLTQSILLAADGLWNVQTGLPLHLCSFSGILTLPLFLLDSPALRRFYVFLSAPAAVVALVYPALMPLSTLPWLAEFCFFALHALIVFAPFMLRGSLEDARGMLGICILLITLAATVDVLFDANYLFLRAIPVGTPFGWMDTLSMRTRIALFAVLAVLVSYVPFKRRKPHEA